ncbi:hypothetical protein [Erythrobacter sp. EC-HK427]|uniref:hypothetical protein n=1 Tax=Erythrobacter sp. EC-HK427 TaxID=2038396 RepID=UPI001254B796|nr:hypothetical protein [Erythrobacter sp. EC-HK427]VVT07363.1 membrane hypothetical protein [Erythrobacter sp. EC-HK427]
MRILEKLRAAPEVWLLPLTVLIAFGLAEFTLGNTVTVAIGYVALFVFIFEAGLIERGSPLRRAGTYFLGAAILCFGNGRLLLALNGGLDSLPRFEWLFDAGHVSLWISAIFHLLELRQQLKASGPHKLETDR